MPVQSGNLERHSTETWAGITSQQNTWVYLNHHHSPLMKLGAQLATNSLGSQDPTVLNWLEYFYYFFSEPEMSKHTGKITGILEWEYMKWFNAKSVRRHNWQGMQWEILSTGVEVPETKSKQNSGGWTHWTAELYLQVSWLFISSHKQHQEEGSKSPGTSVLWQNQGFVCPLLFTDSCVLGCAVSTFSSRMEEP